MSLPDAGRRSPVYVGTGSVRDFTFNFRIFAADQVTVQRLKDGEAVPSAVPPDEYAVSFAEDGGTVSFITPPAKGDMLVILSNVPYTQDLGLNDFGAFNPSDLTQAWDKNTALIQQIKDKVDKAVTVPNIPDQTPEEFVEDIMQASADAKDAADRAEESAQEAADKAEEVKTYSYDIPRVVDSLDKLAAGPDGLYALTGMGNTGEPGEDISNRVVKSAGSSELRALGDRFADRVNVRDFGAKGDGISDDTEAISRAMAAGRGKAVYIPRGTYIISVGIPVPSGVEIFGDGAGRTVLHMPELPPNSYTESVKAEHDGDKTWVEYNAQFSSVFYTEGDEGVRNVSIHDLELRGPYYRAGNDYDDNSVIWTLMNNGICIRGRYYEQRKNLPRVRENYDVSVYRTHIEGFGYAAIHADQIERLYAANNTVRWCGVSGIRMLGCIGAWCFQNDIRHLRPGDRENNTNRMYGITCNRVYGNTTTDLVDGQPNPEITTIYRRSENILMSENYVEDCLYWKGLDTHGGKNVAFINNTIIDCHIGIGTDMAGYLARHGYVRVEDIRIEGNTIMRYAPDNPLEGGADDYTPVEKYACAGAGIECGAKEDSYDGGSGDLWGYNLTIRGNNLYGWGEHGRNRGAINVINYKNIIISDNTIRNSRGSAISTSETTQNLIITDNVIRGVRSTSGEWLTPFTRGFNLGATGGNGLISNNCFWNDSDVELECIRFGKNVDYSIGENQFLNTGSGSLIKFGRPGIIKACPVTMLPRAYGRVNNASGTADGGEVSFKGYGISKVIKISTGFYRVYLTETMYETSRCVANVTSNSVVFATLGLTGCVFETDSDTGETYVRVTTRKSSGDPIDMPFFISVYGFGE